MYYFVGMFVTLFVTFRFMKKIKIMMAEDHKSAREAYLAVLAEETNFSITGDAPNGYELLKLVEKREPDIVLVDIEMPVMDGYMLIRELRARYPNVRPIVLTMHDETYYVAQLVLCGARAYLPKSCSMDEVVETINRVFEKGFYFSESLSKAIVASSFHDKRFRQNLRHIDMTEEEIDALKLVCYERSDRQICAEMRLSPERLSQLKKNVYRKSKAGNLVGLIKFAIINGVMPLQF